MICMALGNRMTGNDTSAWQQQLAELAKACAGARQVEAGDLVLSAHDLLRNAPHAWRRRFAGLPTRDHLLQLTQTGGSAAAALALVDGRAGFIVSQGEGGCPMATVVFAGLTGEVSAEGDCLATALLGALAAALAGPALGGQPDRNADLGEPGIRLH